MISRRHFIKRSAIGSLVLGSGTMPLHAYHDPDTAKITILHTNDVHSRIDPFPMDGSRNEGRGGASKRAALIKKIRSEEENLLLLDAGDIFQGTPYFNFFKGEIEMKLMTQMGYDAATIGNHDFDAGIDTLAKQLDHASFPMIISNYDFSNTVMNDRHIKNKIFTFGKIKVGVTGVGIELNSLVPKNLTKDTQYLDPLKKANEQASYLKNEQGCNYVICLSHLGYKYRESKVSDIDLAKNSKDIDLIIGGHTHTFMRDPDIISNVNGDPVVINQAGWAGLVLGRLDIYLEKNKKGKCVSCRNVFIQ